MNIFVKKTCGILALLAVVMLPACVFASQATNGEPVKKALVSRSTFSIIGEDEGFDVLESGDLAWYIKGEVYDSATSKRVAPEEALQLLMVEFKGETFFTSTDGRYLLRGALFTHENPALVHNVDALNSVTAGGGVRDKAQMSNPNLYSLVLGNGPEKVMLFVAPGCPYCTQTLLEAKGLTDRYTFTVVPVGILGQESSEMVKKLACSNDLKALEILATDNFAALGSTPDNCKQERIDANWHAVRQMRISTVPTLLSADGRVHRGKPENLEAFLRGEE